MPFCLFIPLRRNRRSVQLFNRKIDLDLQEIYFLRLKKKKISFIKRFPYLSIFFFFGGLFAFTWSESTVPVESGSRHYLNSDPKKCHWHTVSSNRKVAKYAKIKPSYTLTQKYGILEYCSCGPQFDSKLVAWMVPTFLSGSIASIVDNPWCLLLLLLLGIFPLLSSPLLACLQVLKVPVHLHTTIIKYETYYQCYGSLTFWYGSGSFSFLQWLSRCQKIKFFDKFFLITGGTYHRNF